MAEQQDVNGKRNLLNCVDRLREAVRDGEIPADLRAITEKVCAAAERVAYLEEWWLILQAKGIVFPETEEMVQLSEVRQELDKATAERRAVQEARREALELAAVECEGACRYCANKIRALLESEVGS